MLDMVRVALAVGLWVVATALMLAATMEREPIVGGWSILCGLWGSILVVWHLLAIERLRAETIAQLAETALKHARLESVE